MLPHDRTSSHSIVILWIIQMNITNKQKIYTHNVCSVNIFKFVCWTILGEREWKKKQSNLLEVSGEINPHTLDMVVLYSMSFFRKIKSFVIHVIGILVHIFISSFFCQQNDICLFIHSIIYFTKSQIYLYTYMLCFMYVNRTLNVNVLHSNQYLLFVISVEL